MLNKSHPFLALLRFGGVSSLHNIMTQYYDTSGRFSALHLNFFSFHLTLKWFWLGIRRFISPHYML